MKKENKKRKEKMEEKEMTMLHHCRSLEIEWKYLNEFDLEEKKDEDAQMKKRSHPAQQQRVEEEMYFVLILWNV